MGRRYYIVSEIQECDEKETFKRQADGQDCHRSDEHTPASAQIKNALESVEEYTEYIKKHGPHFTKELASYASRLMTNASGQKHTWTAEQVKKLLDSVGMSIPEDKIGDATYLANMYYADLYPDALKDDASCLKAAYAQVHDPDGYTGQTFYRWSTDVVKKAISIDWKEFI